MALISTPNYLPGHNSTDPLTSIAHPLLLLAPASSSMKKPAYTTVGHPTALMVGTLARPWTPTGVTQSGPMTPGLNTSPTLLPGYPAKSPCQQPPPLITSRLALPTLFMPSNSPCQTCYWHPLVTAIPRPSSCLCSFCMAPPTSTSRQWLLLHL